MFYKPRQIEISAFLLAFSMVCNTIGTHKEVAMGFHSFLKALLVVLLD